MGFIIYKCYINIPLFYKGTTKLHFCCDLGSTPTSVNKKERKQKRKFVKKNPKAILNKRENFERQCGKIIGRKRPSIFFVCFDLLISGQKYNTKRTSLSAHRTKRETFVSHNVYFSFLLENEKKKKKQTKKTKKKQNKARA